MSLADDPYDTEADEKPSGIAKAEHAPAAPVVNRTLRKGASAASALGERVSKTASAVTPLASEVRKTTEAVGKTTGNIARTAKSTSLGITDRLTTGLTTVLVLCIQALWGGLAFTVVITTSLAYGVGSSITLLGILLWVLGAAIIAFTPAPSEPAQRGGETERTLLPIDVRQARKRAPCPRPTNHAKLRQTLPTAGRTASRLKSRPRRDYGGP